MAGRMMRLAVVMATLAACPALALAGPNQDIVQSVKDSPSFLPAFLVAFLGAVLLGGAMVRRVRH